MTFNFIFSQGLPGKCLHTSYMYEQQRNGAAQHFLIVREFYKTCSWKSLTKNRAKGHIYLDDPP